MTTFAGPGGLEHGFYDFPFSWESSQPILRYFGITTFNGLMMVNDG